jgi:hypothetical protein
MKQCPNCNRTYRDQTLLFCLQCGTPLTKTIDADATHVMSPAPRLQTTIPVTPPEIDGSIFRIQLCTWCGHPTSQKLAYTHKYDWDTRSEQATQDDPANIMPCAFFLFVCSVCNRAVLCHAYWEDDNKVEELAGRRDDLTWFNIVYPGTDTSNR